MCKFRPFCFATGTNSLIFRPGDDDFSTVYASMISLRHSNLEKNEATNSATGSEAICIKQ